MSSPEGGAQPAALLAIGDEVLRGEIANTNDAFIADRLFEAGLELRSTWWSRTTRRRSAPALVRLRAEVDVIVATGGLGPTEDDRTVDAVADLFGTGTRADEPSLGGDEEALLDARLRAHAEQPAAGAHPGRREGAAQRGGDRARVRRAPRRRGGVLPCRASRARWSACSSTRSRRGSPRAWPRRGCRAPAVRTWHVYGMGESHIDHRLAGLLTGVEGATLHFRTSTRSTTSRSWCAARSSKRSRRRWRRSTPSCASASAPASTPSTATRFPAAVAKSLRAQDAATLAIAESCTGGLAGELVTSESGATDFFRGSVVAYADEIKTSVLGVKPETLADFGAVSEPCAREMAEGAKRVCGSSLAVAITGVAGPEGGAPDKPVGTVCFAVCGPGTTRTSTKLFAGNRERVRDGGGLLRAGSGAALLRHAETMTRRRATEPGQTDPQLRGRAASRAAQAATLAAAAELARALPGVKWTRKSREPARHAEVPWPGRAERLASFGGALAASLRRCRASSSRCAASARSRRCATAKCSGRASPTSAAAGRGRRARSRTVGGAARLRRARDRPFHAHVTIGRTKQGVDARAALAPWPTAAFGALRRSDERSVFESRSTRACRGARAPPTSCGTPRSALTRPTDQEKHMETPRNGHGENRDEGLADFGRSPM